MTSHHKTCYIVAIMTIKNRFRILLAEKETREGRRLSYRTVSEETGLSTSTLSSYGTQTVTNFTANTIETLCAYFGCEVGDLLYIDRDS